MLWPKFRIFSTRSGRYLCDRVCDSMNDYVDRRFEKLDGKLDEGKIGTEEGLEHTWIKILRENNYHLSAGNRENNILEAREKELITSEECGLLMAECEEVRESLTDRAFTDNFGEITTKFVPGFSQFTQFSDDEFKYELLESVRGVNTFVIHSPYEHMQIEEETLREIASAANDSPRELEGKLIELIRQKRKTSDNIIEELILIDTLKSNHAEKVFLFKPYRETSRQDHKNRREGINAKLKAKLEEAAGSSYSFFVELHSRQIAMAYEISPDNFNPYKLLIDKFVSDIKIDPKELSTGSPDVGGTPRAKQIAKRLHSSLTLAYKGRDYSRPNTVNEIIIIGDPKRHSVYPDDMIDTGGTLEKAIHETVKKGAEFAYVIAPHALLSGKGVERFDRLYGQGILRGLWTLDSVYRDEDFKDAHPWYNEVSIAPTISESIYKISKNYSVSGVYRNF